MESVACTYAETYLEAFAVGLVFKCVACDTEVEVGTEVDLKLRCLGKVKTIGRVDGYLDKLGGDVLNTLTGVEDTGVEREAVYDILVSRKTCVETCS